MNITEFVLLNLCMNATCPGDEIYTLGLSEIRKQRLKQLGEELSNEHFKITTTHNKPLSWVDSVNNTLVGMGNAFEFLNILQEKYGFGYDVLEPQENTLDVEGNGVMGMLNRGEADIAAAFLPVMTTFKNYIEYSRSLDEGEWVVLMRRPEESATGSGLWAPFTLQVWLLILLSLLVVGPVIYLLIILEVRLRKGEEFPIFPLPACVWFVYGALLKQGSTLSPITDSSRILFATWWIFITILTAFYTANLTAFLTLSKFTLPVNKVDDIGTKRYSWVSTKGTATDQTMKLDNSTFRASVQGSKYDFVDIEGDQILTEWVQERNFLYIGEKPNVEYLMYDDYKRKSNLEESQRCTFVITKWSALTLSRAFAFKRGFKYYELFDEIIQHLVESGIVKYKLREDLPNTEICPLDLGSKERQLRNSDLLMTYVLVGAGFVISGCIFLIELVISLCWGDHRTKTRGSRNRPSLLQNFFSEKSILRGNKEDNRFKFATFTDNNNIKGTLWHELSHGAYNSPPPPPPYHALFQPPFPNSPNGAKRTINGRDYWVVKTVYGETKLIPVRTPSALLFQYSNSK